jgi:hypothetical protein
VADKLLSSVFTAIDVPERVRINLETLKRIQPEFSRFSCRPALISLHPSLCQSITFDFWAIDPRCLAESRPGICESIALLLWIFKGL